VPETAPPEPEMLALIRDRVAGQIGELYPRFAAALLASLDDAPAA
jgi:hypothetical protein